MRLVVTGASGRLASILVPALVTRGDDLVLLDQVDGRLGDQAVVGAELGEIAELLPHFAGAEAVVHLGGASSEGPYPNLRRANLDGVYNVYECARIAGVRRVLLASSHHVVGFRRCGEHIDTAAARPDTVYAASKLFGEAVANLYWDKYSIESAVVRIGSVQPRPIDRRMLSTWISEADFTALIERLLAAEQIGCRTLYAISNNAAAWWPIPEIDGWTPQDRAEDAAQSSLADEAPEAFQGGHFTRLHPFDLSMRDGTGDKDAPAAERP